MFIYLFGFIILHCTLILKPTIYVEKKNKKLQTAELKTLKVNHRPYSSGIFNIIKGVIKPRNVTIIFFVLFLNTFNNSAV